ncbi:MAG: transposase [Wenzhouxiangellaceae bacterium]
MSNHFHLVIKVQHEQALQWNADEIIGRWSQLFSQPDLIKRYRSGDQLSELELDAISDLLETWRKRLYSLSWFMRTLNEPIARQANQEDACTGRFWEGRFTSQALLDEAALLTAMAYVDLNPVRANIAETPEKSHFTSIQERIQHWAKQQRTGAHASISTSLAAAATVLLSFRNPDQAHQSDTETLPFQFEDYLELVDWTGRAIRPDKRGHIHKRYPPILERLGINNHKFLRHMKRNENGFYHMIGRPYRIQEAARMFGVRFFKGQGYAKQLFSASW